MNYNEQLPDFTTRTLFTEKGISYEDQFTSNLNYVVGIAVRMPIFNDFAAKNNVALEKVNLQEASLTAGSLPL